MGSPILLELPDCKVDTVVEAIESAGINVEPESQSSTIRFVCRRERATVVLDFMPEENRRYVVISSLLPGCSWWNFPLKLWQWFKRRSEEIALQADACRALLKLGAEFVDGEWILSQRSEVQPCQKL